MTPQKDNFSRHVGFLEIWNKGLHLSYADVLGISKNVIQQQSLCYFLMDVFWNFYQMESNRSLKIISSDISIMCCTEIACWKLNRTDADAYLIRRCAIQDTALYWSKLPSGKVENYNKINSKHSSYCYRTGNNWVTATNYKPFIFTKS